MTPVKIDKSVIYRMEIRELKDEIARLKEQVSKYDKVRFEHARLKKVEARLGADIGLIEQIDELEAKLDLVQVENARLKALLDTTRENAQTQIFDLQQEIGKFKKMLSEVVDDE